MTSQRISTVFQNCRQQQRAALGVFISAGDPDRQTSEAILHGLPEAGVDIVELGMPFSDPMADGPVIQAGSLRALKAGMTLKSVLEMARGFRAAHPDVPLILMGYYNPIYSYGTDAFIADAVAAGVDGLIMVDLPPEEDAEMCGPAQQAGLDFIRLVTPTTDAARLPVVLKHASGFIYYVSITGITGTRSASGASIADAMQRLHQASDLPVVVGFGIRTPQQVAEAARHADGVVVGSAVVSTIAEGLDEEARPDAACKDRVLAYVRQLASGTARQ